MSALENRRGPAIDPVDEARWLASEARRLLRSGDGCIDPGAAQDLLARLRHLEVTLGPNLNDHRPLRRWLVALRSLVLVARYCASTA